MSTGPYAALSTSPETLDFLAGRWCYILLPWPKMSSSTWCANIISNIRHKLGKSPDHISMFFHPASGHILTIRRCTVHKLNDSPHRNKFGFEYFLADSTHVIRPQTGQAVSLMNRRL